MLNTTRRASAISSISTCASSPAVNSRPWLDSCVGRLRRSAISRNLSIAQVRSMTPPIKDPSTDGDLMKGVFPFSIVSQALSWPSIVATRTASVRASAGVDGGLTGGDGGGAGGGGPATEATVDEAAPAKVMTGLP